MYVFEGLLGQQEANAYCVMFEAFSRLWQILQAYRAAAIEGLDAQSTAASSHVPGFSAQQPTAALLADSYLVTAFTAQALLLESCDCDAHTEFA